MNMRSLLIVFTAFMLAGCGSDRFESGAGVWVDLKQYGYDGYEIGKAFAHGTVIETKENMVQVRVDKVKVYANRKLAETVKVGQTSFFKEDSLTTLEDGQDRYNQQTVIYGVLADILKARSLRSVDDKIEFVMTAAKKLEMNDEVLAFEIYQAFRPVYKAGLHNTKKTLAVKEDLQKAFLLLASSDTASLYYNDAVIASKSASRSRRFSGTGFGVGDYQNKQIQQVAASRSRASAVAFTYLYSYSKTFDGEVISKNGLNEVQEAVSNIDELLEMRSLLSHPQENVTDAQIKNWFLTQLQTKANKLTLDGIRADKYQSEQEVKAALDDAEQLVAPLNKLFGSNVITEQDKKEILTRVRQEIKAELERDKKAFYDIKSLVKVKYDKLKITKSERYLQNFPNGKHRKSVKEFIAHSKKRMDDNAYNKATTRIDSLKSHASIAFHLKKYLEAFPSGLHIKKSKQFIEKFESAKSDANAQAKKVLSQYYIAMKSGDYEAAKKLSYEKTLNEAYLAATNKYTEIPEKPKLTDSSSFSYRVDSMSDLKKGTVVKKVEIYAPGSTSFQSKISFVFVDGQWKLVTRWWRY
jgi:hypothetical protein